MRNKATELIPTRDVPLALVSATAWFVALGLTGYTSINQVGVALVGYLALLLSRALVVKTTVFLLGRLRDYGLRAAARSGIDVSAEHPDKEVKSAITFAATILLCAVILAIIGLTVTITIPTIAYFGFPPLASGFGFAGLLMLGSGLTTLIAFFALSVIVFASAEAVSNKFSVRVSRIEQSEIAVSRLMMERRPAA